MRTLSQAIKMALNVRTKATRFNCNDGFSWHWVMYADL